MAIDYRLSVGTKIDGSDLQKQLDSLPVKKIVIQPTIKGSKEITTMTDDMGRLVTTTTKFDKVGNSLGTTLNSVTANTKNLSSEIKIAESHSSSLATKFVDVTRKVVAFGAITSLIGTFTKLMYEAVESVKVMDDSLTELKKVTDLSGGGLENYTDQAFAMARDLKSTASDVTDAVTEFAKSNYTLEESQTLAKQAIVFQTIADGAVSASDSATMLIQVMKAYNMTVSDSEHIVNSINEVSNQYALSSSDLSNSIGKVASSAKTAGVGFESLLGLMTAGTEVTQNASKTANGLKSILVNLMSDKLSDQFKEFGIDMRDSNGAMKDGYTILQELASAYNNMELVADETGESLITTNDNMNALLEDLGGKYNINTLTAILGNFDNAINATESAFNSANSASDEYAVAMDSIAKKVDGLSGAFQELAWGDGGLQGLIKGFLDAGTGILQFINKTDAINVILVATGVILGANLIPKLILFGTTLITNIGQIALFTAETGSLSAGLKAVGISASVAQVALVGLTLAVSAGVMAWNAYKASQEEAKRLAVESLSAFESQNKSISQSIQNIKNESATKESLISIISSLNKSYDEEEASLKDINTLRQESIDLLYEEAKAKAQETIRETGSEYVKQKGFLEKETTPSSLGISGIEADYGIIGTPEEKLKIAGEYIDAYNEKIDNLSKTEKKQLSILSNYYTDLNDKVSDATSIVDGYENAESILNSTQDEWVKGIQQATEEQEKQTASTEEAKDKLSDYEQTLKDLDATLSILSGTSISGLSDAFEVLKKAQSEINETGELNVDTYESLMGMSAEYQALMFDESGALRTDEASMQAVYRAKIDEMAITSARNMIDLAVKLNDEGKSFADLANDTGSATKAGWEQIAVMMAELELSEKDSKALQVRIDGIKDWAEKAKATVGVYNGMASGASKASSAVDKLSSSVESLLKAQLEDEINKLKDAEEDEVKVLKKRIKVLKKNKETQIDAIDDQIDAINKLKDAEEKRVDNEISALEKEKDSVESYYDAEIAKLQKANTELDRNNKLMELQQNLALAQSSKVMVMGESGKFEYQADEGAVASAEQDLFQYQQELALQQQIESLQAMKDTAIASIDAQISKWEEYKTLMSENYQSQIDSLEEYKQTLSDSYDEQIEALEENVEAVQEQYDAQIEILENYKDNVEEFVNTLSEEQQRQLENQLNTIKQMASNYETDLKNLREYVNKYNSILAQKAQVGATTSISTSTSVGAKKYASGTSGVSSNEVAFVGDAPNTEMVVGSKANGTLMNLAKGTGVVNAESTKTFAGMLNSLSKNSSISGLTSEIANSSTNNSNANVVIQNVTLPSVTDPQSFMEWAQNYSSNMLQLSFGH